MNHKPPMQNLDDNIIFFAVDVFLVEKFKFLHPGKF